MSQPNYRQVNARDSNALQRLISELERALGFGRSNDRNTERGTLATRGYVQDQLNQQTWNNRQTNTTALASLGLYTGIIQGTDLSFIAPPDTRWTLERTPGHSIGHYRLTHHLNRHIVFTANADISDLTDTNANSLSVVIQHQTNDSIDFSVHNSAGEAMDAKVHFVVG